MQVKAISILGSTGSVGTSTLDVIAFANAQAGEQVYEVEALAAGQDVKTLAEQAIAFGAKIAVIADEARLDELARLLAGHVTEAAAGKNAVQVLC